MNQLLKNCFINLAKTNQKALIPYVMAGDPRPDITIDVLHKLVRGGADIIELGIPFSDPMADGPVIQQAAERALQYNTNIIDVLSMVAEFRQINTRTPVVLMGYLNPVEVMGYRVFARKCREAGVNGVLLVDLPPEESADFVPAMQEQDIDIIYLIAPTTTKARIKKIIKNASGYLYYVSLKGVTGAGHLDLKAVEKKLNQIRPLTDLPLAVGFGIKDPETAVAMQKIADGVVVGSVLVNEFKKHADEPDEVAAFVQDILYAMYVAMGKYYINYDVEE